MADPGGERLATSYDLVMFDLDGVVYLDGHAVDHAAREHRRRRAEPARTSRSSRTTPRGPPSRWPSTCASSASTPTPTTS